ncbi:MAG: hypothetical protein V4653_18595 [Pseudomonadota bacterium]
MNATNDLQRVVQQLRRGAPTRHSLEELRRQQQTIPGSAEDCMKLGRDPDRVFAPMRKTQGRPSAA